MIHIGNTYSHNIVYEKPEVTEEEDRPFPQDEPAISSNGASITQDVPALMKLSEQKHSHQVDNFKNIVGGILLGVCTLIIVGFSIADAVFKIDSALFAGAFEFAKTIATAVIGYLFAANAKDK